MEPIVYGEKIRRPEARGLVRDRLVSRLTDPDGPGLGLILGPAGSGKTTLLSTVAAGNPGSAWYRASSEDDEEQALVRHLACALADDRTGTAADADRVRGCGRSGNLHELLTTLQSIDAPTRLLIIDDLHELTGTAAERTLERFLDLRPHRLRVLMAARRPPMINISRLQVSGDLQLLDTDDLRFRTWEVEELFRSVYARPLSPSVAAALARRTGGWAAGLQLFHLATSELTRPDRERAVDQLSGRSRLIRSYLARNVLSGLAPRRRSFLLHSCTLGVLTGDLCDKLLDTIGSASILDELETEQFFTTSTDGGLTYRYHQVLQSHLEVALADELGTRAARDLYARSGALLESSGRVTAAVRAYTRAEDWAAVARLAPQAGHGAAVQDHSRPVEGPPSVALNGSTDDPMLVLAGAHRLLRNGQLEPAVTALRQAESLLDDPDFRRRCAAERGLASIWLPLPAGSRLDHTWAGPPDRSDRVGFELRLITRSAKPGVLTTGLARGVAALLSGDPEVAVSELGPARAGIDDPDDWQHLAIRLAEQLADYLVQGDAAAVLQIDDLVLDADAAGQTWLSRMARGIEAALLLADQPSVARLTTVEDVITECEQVADRWGVLLLSCILGGVHRDAGRAEFATEALRRAEQLAIALGAPVLQNWAVTAGLREPASAPSDSWPVAAPIDEPTIIELQSLGGFSLRRRGSELGWRDLRPRAQALLMLLALHHGRDVHREQLIDALWPDASIASGTRRLQVAISSVRHCLTGGGLPGDCIRRRGDAYALQLTGVHDQLHRFEKLVDQGVREEAGGDARRSLRSRLAALELYTGDLLPEVGPAEWVVEERDRLRALAGRVAGDAARVAVEVGELPTALQATRRSIDLDPYHDPAWQLLIMLQQRLGDRTGAMITERNYAQVRADLGILA